MTAFAAEAAEIDRLRRENRELREELAEWRAAGGTDWWDQGRQALRADISRVAREQGRQWSPGWASGFFVVLARSSGTAVSGPSLLAAVLDMDPGRDQGERSEKFAHVVISHLRRYALAAGAPPVTTTWGLGYSLEPAAAAAWLRRLTDGRGADAD